jgi:hypothetical protein
MKMRPTWWGTLPLALPALLLLLAGCGPPASRPAVGDMGEAVQSSLAGGTDTFDHSAWDALLAATARDDLLDYRKLQEQRPQLNAYLASVARANLSALAPAELKALLINAYNALTVRLILDHPQVTSIRQIDGAWDTISHQEVMNLTAEGSFFRNPAYLEDGRTLVATSVNIRQPALHVWRAPTWEEIAAEEAEKARRETSQ